MLTCAIPRKLKSSDYGVPSSQNARRVPKLLGGADRLPIPRSVLANVAVFTDFRWVIFHLDEKSPLSDRGTSRCDLPAGIANANGHHRGLSRHRDGPRGIQRETTLSWIISTELGNCHARWAGCCSADGQLKVSRVNWQRSIVRESGFTAKWIGHIARRRQRWKQVLGRLELHSIGLGFLYILLFAINSPFVKRAAFARRNRAPQKPSRRQFLDLLHGFRNV